MAHHIAVVEDDIDTLENYIDALSREGYEVTGYTNSEEALRAFNRYKPDLTILDVHLNNQPNGGFYIHQQLNKMFSDRPTIFVSGRDSESDKITGLTLGAWDYVSKPIGVRYLTERVRSLIRISEHRKKAAGEVLPYTQKGLKIDRNSLRAYWFGNLVDLTMTEFSILDLIASNPGRVRSYDELKQATRQRYVETNTINGHIRRIRTKLKKVDPLFKSLKNVHGVGYRWEAPS